MELTFDRGGNEDGNRNHFSHCVWPNFLLLIFFINSKLIMNNSCNYFDNLLANKEHNFKCLSFLKRKKRD